MGVVCSNLIYKRLQLCGGSFILLKEGTQYFFGNGNKWYKERSYLENTNNKIGGLSIIPKLPKIGCT